jgi:hypothetical protein
LIDVKTPFQFKKKKERKEKKTRLVPIDLLIIFPQLEG